ncbi:unnamed protein product [Phytomonas sp. Hart1]|nr:unnamed protein product [Phytomonas sp. Hart1]|eukprot:CCW71060.1 unnamed protein product [Phytomonas sp. isolate Hart1]
MTRSLLVLLTYDDLECGGAADALVEHLKCAAVPLEEQCKLSVEPLPIYEGGPHQVTLRDSLNKHSDDRDVSIIVFSLLKGDQSEEYLNIKNLCNTLNSHVIRCEILTHLANYTDVGLIIQNLVRLVMHEISTEVPNGV